VAEQKIDIDRELTVLESELKRLEAEYNMFFAGRLPRPPWETRGRVDAMVKRLDRSGLINTGARFRFETLQSRFQTFVDLWERGLRAREEGRSGPFAQPSRPDEIKPKRPEDRVLHDILRPDAGDGQAARTLRQPRRRAPPCRRRGGAVSQVRRSD
jgi:hypothetical protein